MAGTFGGYGLPLEGHLPAEFSGEGGVYALEEGNLLPANAQAPEALEEGVVRDEGLVKAVAGRTWSGVEYGVAPVYAYSFFQYVDAVRHGDLPQFLEIEQHTSDWWFPTLDRGAGAALHIACDHGQLDMARFLIEQRGAEVNQQDRAKGWTPLHRVARMAHSRAYPYLELFEYLLQQGADADLLTYEGWNDICTGRLGVPQSVFDVATEAGLGWRPGRLRRMLRALVAKHADVPKRKVFRYEGPPMGPAGMSLFRQWAALEADSFAKAPANWVPHFGPSFEGSDGAQKVSVRPWRKAGLEDGSWHMRPMSDAELKKQETDTKANAKLEFAEDDKSQF